MRAVTLLSSAPIVMALIALAAPASAAEPCDDPAGRALVAAVGRLPGSASLRVVRAPDRVELVEPMSKKVVLAATCEGVRVPLAEGLRRPARASEPAATRAEGPFVVSLTGRGVVSLSIPAGLAAPDELEVVAFDDDSTTITDARGRTWYSVMLRPDGTRVEVEGAHVGCGCERVTSPDGRTSVRPIGR
ncbi:MAG: hypothetical protein IT385_15970 [Deltaproteobacteria bacterium]|nr:hypothetical protein [Deltaproteobacteria bacterium]